MTSLRKQVPAPPADSTPHPSHYERNREKYKAKATAWYAANRELCIERATNRNNNDRQSRLDVTRRYYQRHKEDWTRWREANPDKVKRNSTVYVANRRARRVNAPGVFDFDAWMAKVAYHGWRCFYCHIPLTDETLTKDHRKPLSRGGSNWVANLVPACKPCNSQKWAK
jgi:5-methylcytosine-specific restriction endonuclease McrA